MNKDINSRNICIYVILDGVNAVCLCEIMRFDYGVFLDQGMHGNRQV